MTQTIMYGTTILTICRDGHVVMAGDGQVTLGNTVVKHQAKKVRKMHHDQVLAGFARATPDAFTLFDRLDAKLEQYNGNLKRAAVELAKDWWMDRALRRLEAMLIAADRNDCSAHSRIPRRQTRLLIRLAQGFLVLPMIGAYRIGKFIDKPRSADMRQFLMILGMTVVLAFAATTVLAADSGTQGKAQTICPVMGGKIDRKVYTDYQGKRVSFCCSQCQKDFQKDPAGYVKKLEEEGVTLEKVPGTN